MRDCCSMQSERGSVFTVLDAIATPASLEFRATLRNSTVTMGGRLPDGQGPARFVVRASVPPGARTILKRNGSAVLETNGGVLEREEMTPGRLSGRNRSAGRTGDAAGSVDGQQPDLLAIRADAVKPSEFFSGSTTSGNCR